ncbi:MAG: Holliday junction branch migration protein RuvA [Gemmatimonadaceae bacterium]|jgi:Holliday junction DNA helicase RuvA|nr:Holliday junction branch migration protein RuvA [Gemmatimonadaceae bacterium]
MIARVTGTIIERDVDRVELMTAGGVGYAVLIPLSTFEVLPAVGATATVLTELVVREDGWQLYGFATPLERSVFRRLLTAKGFGAALALGMLSTLSAERLVAAIRARDLATLQRVPRVGRKKAEQLILDLADKLDDVAGGAAAPTIAGVVQPGAAAADDAVRAVAALGYAPEDAMRAVRAVRERDGAGASTADVIRGALQLLG